MSRCFNMSSPYASSSHPIPLSPKETLIFSPRHRNGPVEIRAKEVILVCLALLLLVFSVSLFFKHWKKNYWDINQLPYYAYLYKNENDIGGAVSDCGASMVMEAAGAAGGDIDDGHLFERSQSVNSRCLLQTSRPSSCRLTSARASPGGSQLGEKHVSSMPGSFHAHHSGNQGGVGVGVSVGGGRKAYSSSSHHRRGTSFIHVTKEAMQKMHQSESSVRGMGNFRGFDNFIRSGNSSSMTRSTRHLYRPGGLRRCKSGVERGSFSRFKSRGGVANLRSPIKSSLDHLSERQPPIEGCSAASPDFNAKEGRRTRNEGHKETTLVYVEEPTRTSLEGTRSGIFQRNAKDSEEKQGSSSLSSGLDEQANAVTVPQQPPTNYLAVYVHKQHSLDSPASSVVSILRPHSALPTPSARPRAVEISTHTLVLGTPLSPKPTKSPENCSTLKIASNGGAKLSKACDDSKALSFDENGSIGGEDGNCPLARPTVPEDTYVYLAGRLESTI